MPGPRKQGPHTRNRAGQVGQVGHVGYASYLSIPTKQTDRVVRSADVDSDVNIAGVVGVGVVDSDVNTAPFWCSRDDTHVGIVTSLTWCVRDVGVAGVVGVVDKAATLAWTKSIPKWQQLSKIKAVFRGKKAIRVHFDTSQKVSQGVSFTDQLVSLTRIHKLPKWLFNRLTGQYITQASQKTLCVPQASYENSCFGTPRCVAKKFNKSVESKHSQEPRSSQYASSSNPLTHTRKFKNTT